jgi:hypothetical protein
MALTITDEKMTSDRSRHYAKYRGWWSVSWMPSRMLTREQAITALSLSEAVEKHLAPGSPEWQQCSEWAADLGLPLDDARHWISLPLDPEYERRMRPRQRDADFEAGG